jgi:TrmH family RNA methyltransferase
LGSSHQRVRRLRRLVQKRSLRWSEGVCVLEGPDLVEAALESGVEFEAVYVDAAAHSPALEALTTKAADHGVRVFALAEGVVERIADAQTPQPVVAAVRFEQRDVATLAKTGLTIVLHDLRDPGNVGTIIRSADAAGAASVVLTGQSVDPFNPKTLRASAGSIFHLPVVVSSIEATLSHFGGDAQLLATVVHGGRSHREVDFSTSSVVVIGNEADGLDVATIERCDQTISIPMDGQSESLNAGVAASLIAFEALYQRRDAGAAPSPRSL